MAARRPLYCRNPPHYNGGPRATLLPESASLYWRALRDCSAAIRRSVLLPRTTSPRYNGGMKGSLLPRAASLDWRAERGLSAAIRRAL